jgi:Zn-dependent peptidase ImmA (M78 family)
MKIESNRKQEQRARAWAFNTLAPFDKIIEAYEKGYVSTYEMAEYLNVTEDFLKEAILYYQNKK